nr:oligosaccharide flippase family protein [uncultured Fusobacterium sp.]
MSRIENTLKNMFSGLIAQIIVLVMNFINRTIFIKFLGVEYLGLSGLFSNILSMLSLAELGVGVAISFSLYKPLAQKDIRKIKALMNFYSKAYHLIGIVILVLGICLIPFLDFFIKEKPNIKNFILIYMLFLGNSVISYFFTYKRSLLSADQKEYINIINRTIFMIIQSIVQFLVLIVFRNYIVYLLVVIICTLISNIEISIKCNRMYPFLKKNKENLNKSETKILLKYVGAQMSHKVGGIVVNGTDNILITSLLKNGLVIVGLYSNYLLIINAVRNIINMFFLSVTASVGNLNAEENKEKSKQIFNNIFFLNMFFYGVTSNCIFNLINDFIRIWLGEKYILSLDIVIVIVINYFITGMRQSCITFNTTLGLFWNDRFKPWIEAIINLIVSIILIKYFGFIGILLGTLISTLVTSFWIEPFILYKNGFKEKLTEYFKKYIKYTLIIGALTYITYVITNLIVVNSFIQWVLKGTFIFFISIFLIILIFNKTAEIKELKKIIEILLNKLSILKKRRN